MDEIELRILIRGLIQQLYDGINGKIHGEPSPHDILFQLKKIEKFTLELENLK